MPKTSNNYTQLFNQMSGNIPLALEIIATLVQNKWKELIQENFYNEYEPKKYERTYAILEALVKSDVSFSSGAYYIKIYIDNDIMNRIHEATDGFASGEEIAEIIERKGFTTYDGTTRNPSNAFDTTVEMLKRDFRKLVKEVMGSPRIKIL